MKRYFTLYVIREMQIKTMRYPYTPIRMAPTHLLEWPKSGTLTTSNAGKDVEQEELSFIADGTAKWYSHFERQFGGFLRNATYSYHMTQQSSSLVFTQRS